MRDTSQKWRMLLGRFAQKELGSILSTQDQKRDQSLGYLYDREYQKRGIKLDADSSRAGSNDPSEPKALRWLDEAQTLFPRRVFEKIEKDAIERFQLQELLQDSKRLEKITPSTNLLGVLLREQERAEGALKSQLRHIAQNVIDALLERLKTRIQPSFSGRRNRRSSTSHRCAANFNMSKTIRRNLKNWQHDHKLMILEEVHFFARQKRHLDWNIVIAVDQSGSMQTSLIYAALCAAIFAGIPGIKVNLVLFDTSVVDLSGQVEDPLGVLLSVHLGGGTDIGQAVEYCETLITQPSRTIFVLVSDFYEGAHPRPLLNAISRMNSSEVKMLGIAALDDSGTAIYEPRIAQKLANIGMNVAALTPDALAEWVAEAVSQ